MQIFIYVQLFKPTKKEDSHFHKLTLKRYAFIVK